MMKLAQETGLTREALYRMLSEDGNPTLDTLLKVAAAGTLRRGPSSCALESVS